MITYPYKSWEECLASGYGIEYGGDGEASEIPSTADASDFADVYGGELVRVGPEGWLASRPQVGVSGIADIDGDVGLDGGSGLGYTFGDFTEALLMQGWFGGGEPTLPSPTPPAAPIVFEKQTPEGPIAVMQDWSPEIMYQRTTEIERAKRQGFSEGSQMASVVDDSGNSNVGLALAAVAGVGLLLVVAS